MTIPISATWTKPQYTTLIHALALSPPDASSLLPYTQSEITSTIRKLSLLLDNPSTWTTPRHTRALLKQLTGLNPPTKPRRKKLPPPPKHRVSIQLIPSTPQDDAIVRAVGCYPFVEVVLKPGRRVWDIVKHLYSKWGLPVRVMKDHRDVAVDSLVVELLEKGSRVVRVPYKLLKVDIDWSPLAGIFEQQVVNTPGRKRIFAPRDDDAFWTGAFSPIKPGITEQHSPAGVNLQQQQLCETIRGNTGNDSLSQHERPGEQAVLSRLRGHLQRLDSQEKAQDESITSPLVETLQEEDGDFAVIPEQFLQSCSRYDLAHSLPESLLSLGKSDHSRDDAGNSSDKSRKIADAETVRDESENDGTVGEREEVNGVEVLNDAFDVGHELDLRCDEDLHGMDVFPCVELGPVSGPSLSLSALFRE